MVKVSDILFGSIGKYLEIHKLSYKQRKVVNKLINCFSENSPEIQFTCSNKDCGYTETKKKPCRDRHCNRCNNNKKNKWVLKLIKEFPVMNYYHVVNTVPSELNNLFICNQSVLYDILFKSSFYTLNKFAADKKHYGGKIGYVSLLHTWGQQMNYHPHLHFMVLSGGIKDGKYKELPYHEDFIFPVEAMSKVMSGKFIEMLKQKYEQGELSFPGELEKIRGQQDFNNFLYGLSQKEWVIYSKKPFPKTEKVLEYISRYTHKVAISNNRIKSYDGKEVVFEYRDYRDKDKHGVPKIKEKGLTDLLFIQRFLLHILPDGFRKIRYGGIFSSNQRRESIRIIKENLKERLALIEKRVEKIIEELEKAIRNECPICSENMVPVRITSLSGYL